MKLHNCDNPGCCIVCGDDKDSHTIYINELERIGFYTWAIDARIRWKKKEPFYCPKAEIKFTDKTLNII